MIRRTVLVVIAAVVLTATLCLIAGRLWGWTG